MVIAFGLYWNKDWFINAWNVLLQHDKHTHPTHTRARARKHTHAHTLCSIPSSSQQGDVGLMYIDKKFVLLSTHYYSRLRTVSLVLLICCKFTLCADSRNCTVQGVVMSEHVSRWGCAVALSVDSVTDTWHKYGHNFVLVCVFNERRCQLLRSWGVGDKTREWVRSIG